MMLVADSGGVIAPSQTAMNQGQDIDHTHPGTPRGRILYACVVIDAAAVFEAAGAPIGDTAHPLPIASSQAFMAASAIGPDDTRGDGAVIRDARVGDILRIFAISASNQFEDAIVIACIGAAGGDPVVDRCELVTRERLTIAPASATAALPAQLVQQPFAFGSCRVIGEGVGKLHLEFAIYDRDDRGQPRFAGLYQWEPTLTLFFYTSVEKPTSQNQET